MTGNDDQHYQPWLDRGAADIGRPAALPTRPAASAPPAIFPEKADRDRSADELLSRPLPPMSAVGTTPPTMGERIGAVWERVSDAAAAANARMEPARRSRDAAALTVSAIRHAGNATFAASRAAWSRTEPMVRAGVHRAGQLLGDGGQMISTIARDGSERIGARARAALAARGVASHTAPTIESQLDRLIADGPPKTASSDLPLFGQSPPMADMPVPDNPLPTPQNPAPHGGMIADASMANRTGGSSSPQTQRTSTGPNSVDHSGSGGGSNRAVGSNWLRQPATLVLGGAAILFGGFAAGQYWTGPGVDRVSTELVVHDYLLNHPEILPQAMERLQATRTTEALNRVRDRLVRPFSGAWTGNADGDVTLVMFSDYACTYCRASLPDVDRLLREDPQLKIVFRELPILSRDSEAAARLALAAARRGRYMPMHRALFASGRPDEEARRQAAISLDVANDAVVLSDAGITAELRGNVAMARELGFDGTPAWVVGNKILSGAVGYQALRQAIAEARR